MRECTVRTPTVAHQPDFTDRGSELHLIRVLTDTFTFSDSQRRGFTATSHTRTAPAVSAAPRSLRAHRDDGVHTCRSTGWKPGRDRPDDGEHEAHERKGWPIQGLDSEQ
jgi:hypothetical protein